TDTLSHIFEPMTRGSDTETFNHDGLGMNMYINRMILKKYGGDITVASQIEQGTLVNVRMPEAGSRSVGAEGLIIYGENS
ncbi:ATP-binding protein, partial [Candidatus Saccharibacteria bacterium]|nr:ATP-binding protein [Candidatus Saccharibacteria bacterium]